MENKLAPLCLVSLFFPLYHSNLLGEDMKTLTWFKFILTLSNSSFFFYSLVRTALVALIAFMPTNPDGALGSLDYKKEERRALAIKSREAPPKVGTPERQKLIDEIHQYMLSKAPPVPQIPSTATTGEEPNNAASEEEDSNTLVPAEQHPHPELEQRIVEDVREVRVNAAAVGIRLSFSAGVRLSRRVPAAAATDEQVQVQVQGNNEASRVQKPPMDDRLFTWAAIGLTVAIVILLVKKFLKSQGIAAGYLDIP